jgi:hypothetical protein
MVFLVAIQFYLQAQILDLQMVPLVQRRDHHGLLRT